jgi:hypothetical protein
MNYTKYQYQKQYYFSLIVLFYPEYKITSQIAQQNRD